MLNVQRNRLDKPVKFPEGNTLYMYRNGRRVSPLYNGISNNMDRRVYQHGRKSQWFESAETVYTVNGFNTRTSLINAEKRSIRTTYPIHNTQHNAKARARPEDNFFVKEHPEWLVPMLIVVALVIGMAIFAALLYCAYKVIRASVTGITRAFRYAQKKIQRKEPQ